MTLTEVNLSTTSTIVHEVGTGSFHCKLNEVIQLNSYHPKVGVKNVSTPTLKKTISFKLYMGHFLEKMDPSKMKKYTVTYNSLYDLCSRIESLCYASLGEFENPNLDFSNANSLQFLPFFSMSLDYGGKKFILKKHSNFVIILSSNIARLLGMHTAILEAHTVEEKKKQIRIGNNK